VVADAGVVEPIVIALEPSDTVTDATGTTLTVTVANPLRPSLVAVMFALPTVSAVTNPLLDTVATVLFDDDHTIVRPLSSLPPASRVIADACVVAPITTAVAPSDTVTDATGAGTIVTFADALCPSLVAVIAATPALTPVTTPVLDTDATVGLELDHVITRPLNMLLAASRSVAVACVVAPTTTAVAASDTLTVATGTAETVTVANALRPSLVAVMSAVPGEIAVTVPLDDTVATAVFDDDHATTRPVNVVPAASRVIADACVLVPTTMALAPSETLTDATGGTITVTVAVPDRDSLVAVMSAVPADTAVTTPLLDTVATALFDVVHVTGRADNTLPAASRVTAVACVVAPMMTGVAPSETVTLATGGTITVTDAVPDRPSLVAVISALPTATAVTTPVLDTVATALFDDVHATARPDNTLFAASRVTAVACVVAPITTVVAANDTPTLATGTGVTLNAAEPLRPSLVAVIDAEPTLSAVTTPLLDTVATDAFDVVHTIARPVNTKFNPSRNTALACVVAPATTVVAASDTSTVATGANVTLTDADPLCPSLVAVIDVVPTAIAVTTPLLDTVATAGFALDHTTGRPVNTLANASRNTALADVVAPTLTLEAPSETDTVATGASPMLTLA